MAVFQFHSIIIPRQSLVEKLGYLPDKIKPLKDKNLGVSETKTLVKDCWVAANISAKEIIEVIDNYNWVDRSSWGQTETSVHWKTYINTPTEQLDNDAGIEFNSEFGVVTNLSFRADLRNKKNVFLKNMIDLSKDYDWLFLDAKGNIAHTRDNEKLIQFIYNSDANRFLRNPEAYLEDFRLNNPDLFSK